TWPSRPTSGWPARATAARQGRAAARWRCSPQAWAAAGSGWPARRRPSALGHSSPVRSYRPRFGGGFFYMRRPGAIEMRAQIDPVQPVKEGFAFNIKDEKGEQWVAIVYSTREEAEAGHDLIQKALLTSVAAIWAHSDSGRRWK